MAGHDIVVIGASAGGVEAVTWVVQGLPAGLRAAVFVVVHFPASSRSMLPQILSRAGPLPARHAEHGERWAEGIIYVAPPDHHMVLHDGEIRLLRGPRENGVRPALDPLFRSAARWCGPRVVGVVLTGSLDDGAAGLLAIHQRGGVCVAQDPEGALYDGMPRAAVETGVVDHVLPLDEIGPAVARLALVEVTTSEEEARVDDRMEMETDTMEMHPDALNAEERPGTPTGFTCPECHGAVWEIQEGEMVRFRCRVGHGFTFESLMAEQGRDVEAALWTAYRALRERAALCRKMARRMADRGQATIATRYSAQADEAQQHAAVLQEVLLTTGNPQAEASD